MKNPSYPEAVYMIKMKRERAKAAWALQRRARRRGQLTALFDAALGRVPRPRP